MKQFLFFIFIAFIATSCKRTDPRILEYFDTEGYGYVYYKSTRQPVPNAKVWVSYSGFPYYKYATQSHMDIYYTDSTGFYSMKCLKSKGGESPIGFSIDAWDDATRRGSYGFNVKIQEFKNSQIVKLDTLFINKNYATQN